MAVLSSISTAVNLMNSKLTVVTESMKCLSERQDRLEASLEQLTAALQPVIRSQPTPVLPQPANVSPVPQPSISQPPVSPSPDLPQAQQQPRPSLAPTGSQSAAPCLSTPVFDQASAVTPWYSNALDDSTAPEREYVEHTKIMELKCSGISRKNFAKKLVEIIFTKKERSTSNVNGRNKPKLDPVRITYVKKKAFMMYPCNPHVEKEEKAWAECVIAIDEGNRRLNRK